MPGDETSGQPPAPAELGVWQLVGIGGSAVGSIVAGLALGWLADLRLDTSPVLVLAGIAVGMLAAVVTSWIRIKPFLRG